MKRILVWSAMCLCIAWPALAADKPLYEAPNAVIDKQIRAAFGDEDPFAAAKVVGLLYAERVQVGRAGAPGDAVARDVILAGLAKEGEAFRKRMPDFRIDERDLFVSDNGVVMTGRMRGNGEGGQSMDTAFVTVMTRDKIGRIVSQQTYETPRSGK